MKLINIEATNAYPIIVLFGVLKDVLTESSIIFKKTIDNSKENPKESRCMIINEFNSKQTIFINLKLSNEMFSKFELENPMHAFGVDLEIFYKLIKPINKKDKLTISVEHENINIIKLNIESSDNIMKSEFELTSRDLNIMDNNLNQQGDFTKIIIMDSNDFHNQICKQLNALSDKIKITCRDNSITFETYFENNDYNGSATNGKFILTELKDQQIDENGHVIHNRIKIINNKDSKDYQENEEVVGIFNIKDISSFHKFSALSDDIKIYFKNKYPLMLYYTIASGGRIIVGFSPCDENNINNDNDNDAYYDSDIESIEE